jgi:hypothetical protein
MYKMLSELPARSLMKQLNQLLNCCLNQMSVICSLGNTPMLRVTHQCRMLNKTKYLFGQTGKANA